MADRGEAVASEAGEWLREQALPLWAGAGFDAVRGLFHEQLDFSGRPVAGSKARAMVQARQISVFASAALSGRYPAGRALALTAAQTLVDRYWAADGAPGWAFALNEDGEPDSLRDLYAHAFVLFGLAWAMRIEARPAFVQAVERTLDFLDTTMADPHHGGLWDSLPRPDAMRRQNPHMHLFEAYLALHAATGEARFLDRSRALRDLAAEYLISPTSGALREFFHDDWRVVRREGETGGVVEPGHQYEWAWLLDWYQHASGEDQAALIGPLMHMAARGLDRASGRIVDEIAEDGRVTGGSSRSWPHAEALKAITAIPSSLGGGDDEAVKTILARLMRSYCLPELRGGWQDHLDEKDRPVRPAMPASTLYHLYFGMVAVEDALVGVAG